MNRNTTILLLFFIMNLTFSQIKVEKIKFTETIDNRYESRLPKLINESEDKKLIADKINAYILDRFIITTFNQNDLDEFRWYDVDFEYEIKENILYLLFGGEYYGAYPNYVEEESFFDLTTGERLSNTDIPFQALFSLNGYLDFMNKFWLKEAKPAFDEAIECAEYEPYCSYYDIYDYTIVNDKLRISLADDCYAKVSRACRPIVNLTLPIDSMKTYFSKEGHKLIFIDSYPSKKGIDKFLYNRLVSKDLPINMYLFGKIDSKYPFSMALNFKKNSQNISGFYYYDQKLEKLKLTGIKEDENNIRLQESQNNIETGSFIIELSSSYVKDALYINHIAKRKNIYLSGTWSDPDKTKIYDVEFTEVKFFNMN